MAELASRSVPLDALGTHDSRAAGDRPVAPANAVELSCSDLEFVEEDSCPAPTSPQESIGSRTPNTRGRTPERPTPVAAMHQGSRRLILAAVTATLCAAVTVGAFAFARSNGPPSDNAQSGLVAKSAPTATSVPASRPAHPALKKRSTANAQLASVRAVHPQPGQKPSSRAAAASGTAKGKMKQKGTAAKGKMKQKGTAAKGKMKQKGAAAKGKSSSSTLARANGKTAAKTVS